MKQLLKIRHLSALSVLFLLISSCGSDATKEQASTVSVTEDLETAYFRLNGEVETETLGTKAKSRSALRRELLAKADTDGDGTLSEAEKASFRASWQELKAELASKLKAELDTDKDGKLSKEEILNALKVSAKELKTELFAALKDMIAAHREAKKKIREVCGGGASADSPILAEEPAQGSAEPSETEARNTESKTLGTDIEARFQQCQSALSEEKLKFKETLKSKLSELRDRFDELKQILEQVEAKTRSS